MNDPAKRDPTELLRRARQGDAECRDQLFAACRSYLGLVARAQVESWLRVKVDASDIVQQTMLEAHRDFDRFEGESEQQWLGWLKKILAHNVHDFIRHYRGAAKRRVGREVPIRAAGESSLVGAVAEPASPEGTPSQELIRLQSELELTAALAEMPPDYQEVIMLRNFQRLSFDEVAQRMGRSRPAVQMLWMRALKRLERSLASDSQRRSL